MVTDPWRALACAVLGQAMQDAHHPGGRKAARAAGLPEGVTLADDSRDFIHGPGAADLLGLLDLDLDGAGLARIRAELPPPAQPALPGL